MAKKKHEKSNPARVIIPLGSPNRPQPHELDVAYVLAQHYKTVVEFIVPADDYRRKSADIMFNGVEWEIKSPTGNTKRTIETQFSRASRQAKNIILDTRRTKLKYDNIVNQVFVEIQNRPKIKRVILIDKSKKVVDMKK